MAPEISNLLSNRLYGAAQVLCQIFEIVADLVFRLISDLVITPTYCVSRGLLLILENTNSYQSETMSAIII